MEQYFKDYYQDHKKHLNDLTKTWIKNHPDRVKELAKISYKKTYKPHPRQKRFTPEELKQHQKDYKNRPEVKQHNKEMKKLRTKRNPEKYLLIKKRAQFKRRGLGHNYLNKVFENSHGHHVNINDVIFIPEQLHNSILHNIWTGEGITEINDKVRAWLTEQNISIQFEYIPITDLSLILSKQRGRPRKELTDPRAKHKQLYNTLRYQRIKCKTIYPLAIYRDTRAIQPII